MAAPTIDERLDIWRVTYSRASLRQAQDIGDVLLAIQPHISVAHRLGLLTGLVVTYARPFSCAQLTKERRIIPMHDIEIPSQHRELHESFMEMRHQVFGHKDATGPSVDDGVLNQVLFVIKGGYLRPCTVTPASYDHEKIEEMKLLCGQLLSVLDDKLNDLMERYPMPISAQDGTYSLNIHDPGRPWVVRA